MFNLVRDAISVDAAINEQHQWPVRFTATYTADDSPAKVFVMQVCGTDLAGDSLSCVANATQMTDLPEDAADTSGPYYRINQVTKLCRSAEAADEFIEKVKDAVQDLANNLTAASSLAEAELVTILPE